jgi:excisionase family DNA binding protein
MIKMFANQLNKIEKLVISIDKNKTEFMDIQEASNFLKLKVSTIYQFVDRNKIPFHKPTKKLLFKKSELVEWVEKNRVLTIDELEKNRFELLMQEGVSDAKIN